MAVENSSKNSISQKLLVIVILPMLLLAGATAVLGYNMTLSSLTSGLQSELETTAAMTDKVIDTLYPGDFFLVGDDSLKLFKGEKDITTEYSLVDEISAHTGLEMSIIFKDTRVLTTIRDKENKRIVGTGIADQVNSKLTSSTEGLFYNKTLINHENFFSYYYPLYNQDGSFTGAIEICSPYGPISSLAWKSVLIVVALIILVMILLIVLIYMHVQNQNAAIDKLLKFTKQAASGNDSAELDPLLLGRDDELGAIGSSVLEMHRSMRDMMEKDTLTKIFNRRSANRKLDIIRSHYKNDGKPYSVAIGDIDFFKKVNDTYGHDAGDTVLIAVSEILQKHLKSLGFVARWGGEEFLLVFDKMDGYEAEKHLRKILDEVRATQIEYDGIKIKVTMSFGIACAPELSQDELIKMADEKLYYAKENGRNRIVSIIPADK